MKNFFTRFILLSLFFSFSSFLPTAYGQLEIIWDKSYGGRGGDQLSSAIMLPSGQVLLYGSSNSPISGNKTASLIGNNDYWLMMMDTEGNKLWDKSYGGDDYDRLTSVVPMQDGGFLLGGYSRSEASGDKSDGRRGQREFDTDMWVLRINATGEKVWDKTYGGNLDDYLYTATPTDDGGFLLLGVSQSGISFEKTAAPRGSYDFWLVKIDGAGNKLWDKAYGGNGSELDAHTLLRVGENYLIGGSSYSGISGEKSSPSRGDADYWLLMIDNEGEKLWDKTYGGSDSDRLNTMIALNDGGFLLGGASVSDASGDKSQNSRGTTDLWMIRLDEEGNMLWERTYGGDGGEGVSDILETPEGDFLLGAASSSNVSGEKTEGARGPNGSTDIWLLKIEGSGDKLWDKTIGGNQHDGSGAFIPLPNGFLLAGGSYSEISGDRTAEHYGSADFWVLNFILEEEASEPVDPENALSGTFTIGGANPDYDSFSTAITAIEERGVKGPVTFKVRPGTYIESLEINSIPGNSCNNAIIFEGEGTAPAQVIIQSPVDSITTFRINGIDGIGFRNVSIVRGVEVEPGSDCFSLEDNILSGSIHARSSNLSRNNHHFYRNNIFQEGMINVTNQSPWNPETPVFDQGLVIEGNEFRHSGSAIFVSNQQGFTISKNMIKNFTSGGAAITVINSWYGDEISENIISGAAGMGLKLNSAAAGEITENQISFKDGGVAMEITTGKSLGDEMFIANNLLIVDGYDARGIYFFPIDNLVGLNIHNPLVERLELYHNTMYISGYSDYVPNYALFITGKNRSYHIFNNVIVNFASGKDIILRDNQAVAAMDYNNFTAYLPAIWGIQEVNSLGEWQRITGYDAHSIATNPGNPIGPNEAITGQGIYLSEVPQDVFGQERNNPPTIGAVERVRTTTPLSGIYTIGGENPDFANFTDAISAVENAGVADSVLFKVRPGEYHEQLNLSMSFVQGIKVIFEGESGDNTDVVLNYPLDEVLVVHGARNYIFRYLTFGSGIRLSNSGNLLFESNVIRGGVNASIVSNDTYLNNLFQEKGISKAGEGVVYQGGRYFFNADGPVVISGNTFNVQDEAIDLYAQANVEITNNRINLDTSGPVPSDITAIRINSNEGIKAIKNNTIISKLPNTTGISLDGIYFAGDLPKELTHNKIELQHGGTGISIGYSGSSSADGLIANNMISVNAIDQSTGIYLSNTPGNIHIYSNNIALYGEGNNSRVLYLGSEIEEDIHLYNNIFANLAGGKVFVGDYFQDSVDKIAESNFNDLFTTGDVFAQWEGKAISHLSAWHSTTGLDSHSFSVDPEFESVLSLTPHNAVLDGAGIAILPEVETDFFGEIRSYPPDIGAVEFEPGIGEPEAPEPTPGFVLGGAVFHSPAGAIPHDPMAEGRAIISFHADQKRGEERPKGVASLTIPTEGFRFNSVNAWDWISVNEHTAILQGTGALNREEGYRFLISVADNGTGPMEPKDTYRMIIRDPDGEVVYDNQPELGLYTVASMPIERGNIMVGRELRANARLSQTPSVEGTTIQEFKAYPTLLDGNGLWLEVPDHGFTSAVEIQLSIHDRQGRVMREITLKRAGKQLVKLQSEYWAPGIYLLIIRVNEQQFQQKLVKQE